MGRLRRGAARAPRIFPLLTAYLLAGCAGAIPPSIGQPASGEAESLASALPPLSAILPSDTAAGTPTEVYTRIARGALTCWFGAGGPLKAGYIYHAEAAPPSKGGQSAIDIYVRDPSAPEPRSKKAYRITILPSGSAAKVEIENLAIPEPLSARMNADVARWSRDEGGCGDDPVTRGWSAEQRSPSPDSAQRKSASRTH